MSYEAGLRNVQFDDPVLAYFCSEQFRKGWEEDTGNTGTVDELLDAYIALQRLRLENQNAHRRSPVSRKFHRWETLCGGCIRHYLDVTVYRLECQHILSGIRHRESGSI